MPRRRPGGVRPGRRPQRTQPGEAAPWACPEAGETLSEAFARVNRDIQKGQKLSGQEGMRTTAVALRPERNTTLSGDISGTPVLPAGKFF